MCMSNRAKYYLNYFVWGTSLLSTKLNFFQYKLLNFKRGTTICQCYYTFSFDTLLICYSTAMEGIWRTTCQVFIFSLPVPTIFFCSSWGPKLKCLQNKIQRIVVWQCISPADIILCFLESLVDFTITNVCSNKNV